MPNSIALYSGDILNQHFSMNDVASSRLLAKQQQIYRINLGYTAENRMDVTPVNRSVTLSAINRRSIPFNLSKPIGQYMHRQLEHRNYALCTHYVVMYSIRFVRQTVFNYFNTPNSSVSAGSIVLCVAWYDLKLYTYTHTNNRNTKIDRTDEQTHR